MKSITNIIKARKIEDRELVNFELSKSKHTKLKEKLKQNKIHKVDFFESIVDAYLAEK